MLDLFKKRKSSKEDEENRRRRVTAILDQAMGQRAKLHIRFDEAATTITGVSGTIMAVDGGAMILDLSGIGALKESFVGQSMECFFRLVDRDNRNREIFYTFHTRILRIRQSSASGPRLVAAIPESVDGSQRRKSLRLKPDLEKFSHIAFWKYDASGGFDIAKPHISHQHFKQNLALLDNVSAGGLRLLLRQPVLKEQQLSLQKGDRFIVFFTFAEELTRLRQEYWLVVKINNIRVEAADGDVNLGMEFIANGERQAEAGKIAWNKVDDNVIDDLAQRIYHWHLALYRDRGLS